MRHHKNKLKLQLLFLCIIILHIALISCVPKTDEIAGIENTLKLSAYVYLDMEKGDSYALEELVLNEPRYLAREDVTKLNNYHIWCTFDGGVIKIAADNKDIQLSTGQRYELWKNVEDCRTRTFGVHAQLPDEGYVSVSPLGTGYGSYMWSDRDNLIGVDAYTGEEYSGKIDSYTGKEYWLTVKAYALIHPDTPIVTAKLKLVRSEETVSDEFEENRKSQYFTIELTEYEYSDMYQLMEE